MLKIYSLLLFHFFIISYFSFAQIDKEKEIKLKINSVIQTGTGLGTEFVIAFPPNDKPTHGSPQDELNVYICSPVNTQFEVFNDGIGIDKIYNINANTINSYTSVNRNGPISLGWEARDYNKVSNLGFIIKSKDPICVYVLSVRNQSSDGYMAIPTSNWGKKYYYLSFYDYHETEKWGGGFIVLANQDSTHVKISLKSGVGSISGFGKIYNPGNNFDKTIGDTINFTFNRGQIYTVQGEGETNGIFDISGSLITADKSIGLISYHEKTAIPQDLISSKNCLNEMLPPVENWDTLYSAVEFKRKGRGDFYRVISAYDNNQFEVKWYDTKDKNLVGEKNGILKKGQIFEYLMNGQVFPATDPKSIRGISVWHFTKPAMVAQYSYSSNWDNMQMNAPNQVILPSINQFTKNSIFCVPEKFGEAFTNNYINLIAVGDTTDQINNEKLLKSIKLDGKNLYLIDSNFISNNIPETNLFWTSVPVVPGSHSLNGDSVFGGIVYGYNKTQSYSWPISQLNIDDANKIDSSKNKYNINGKVTDSKTGKGIANIQIPIKTKSRDYNTISDNQGNFSFILVDSGLVEINPTVVYKHYKLFNPSTYKFNLSKDTNNLNFIITQPNDYVNISGHVFENGVGAKNFLVKISDIYGMDSTFSDSLGNYKFENSPTTTSKISIVSPNNYYSLPIFYNLNIKNDNSNVNFYIYKNGDSVRLSGRIMLDMVGLTDIKIKVSNQTSSDTVISSYINGFFTYKNVPSILKIEPFSDKYDFFPTSYSVILYKDTVNFYFNASIKTSVENPRINYNGFISVIFPNPADNQLNLIINDNLINPKIRIIDMMGIERKSFNLENINKSLIIPTNELEVGLYTLEINSNNVLSSTKFMVIR